MDSTTVLTKAIAAQSGAEIDGANVRIYFLSRNWLFLAALALGILAFAAMLGRHLGTDSVQVQAGEPQALVLNTLASPVPDLNLIIRNLPLVEQPASAEVRGAIEKAALTTMARAMVSAFSSSLAEGEPTAQLFILAHQPDPHPGANECVGDLLVRAGDLQRARQYYAREIEIAPNQITREKLVGLLVREHDFAGLMGLSADPGFATAISADVQLRIAIQRGDWSSVVGKFFYAEFSTLRSQPLIMALAAAFAWLLIAIHAAQPHNLLSFRTVAPLIATSSGLIGGVVAQFLTVFIGEKFGISEGRGIVANIGFYAGVIAPRDMLIQVLLMLPFVPSLLRRRTALDTLVVTGCVGLGFAIPTNLEFCTTFQPADSLARLLTANFFHFAAAALVGQALCRCLLREKGSVRAAAMLTAAVVLTQGVYDAFTRIPGAHLLLVLSTLAFLILSGVFFGQLRQGRDSVTDQCFLGATLVISLAFLLSAVLVAASTQSGFEYASWALLRNSPTLLLVGLVFFSQFKRGFAPIGSDLTTSSNE